MAYVDYENNGTSGGYDSSSQGISDPSPQSSNVDPYSTVAGFYQTLLGRQPESRDAAMGWWNGTGGNLDAIQAGLAASDDGRAYAALQAGGGLVARNDPAGGGTGPQGGSTAPQAPSGLSGRTMDDGQIASYVAQWASMAGADPSLSNDPGYWVRRIKETGGLGSDNLQYWQNASVGPTAFFNNPNRETSSQATPTSYTPSYAATGGNPGGYTDPSAQLYLQQVLQRLNQVQQPQDNSIYDLLKSLATQQATKLQQAPYTPADDAALITQYRQPLTQARDAAKQQAALDLSRRGFTPTSGVYQDRMRQIDQAYEGGIAQGANQMGVNAVALKNANANQALQILSSLSSANNTQIDRSNVMSDQAVALAKMFPDFDAQRLNQLLTASGDTSSSSALSSLMSLGNLNAGVINTNNLNDQANAAAWGKLIAGLIGAI